MNRNRIIATLVVAAVAALTWNAADHSVAHAQDGAKAQKSMKKSTKKATGKVVKLDQGNGTIEFVGAKVTGDHDGGFKKWTGKAVTTKGGELQKLSFNIDTTSVWTDNDKLTGHLKSPDFFDVAKFPKATFQSSKIEPIESDDATHKITGVMNLHGVIKKISFPATIEKKGNVIHANTEFVINRFDWDITYKGKADDLIKNAVLLKIKLEIPTK